MTRVGVISDTHIPARAKRLPDAVHRLFEGVAVILHAGDVVDGSVLDELATIAPVHGVLGNVDPLSLSARLPQHRVVEVGGVKIGMVHDSGQTGGRRERMKKAFPGCRVVVFGHSHQPVVEDDGDLLLLNPGSACDPRWAKVPTIAVMDIADGEVSAQLVEVSDG